MDLWEFYQQRQISEHSTRISRVENARTDWENSARDLQRQIDKLQLANLALWSLLQDKLGLTDTQLADRIREIDLRDGSLDGRAAAQGRQCPACRRVMSVRHHKCLYCGEADFTPRTFT